MFVSHLIFCIFIYNQTITGIYTNSFDASLNTKHGFPVFSTLIVANHVSRAPSSDAHLGLTEDDKIAIRQLAKDPKIGQKVRIFFHFCVQNNRNKP